jgi:uncharacterized membrane-anchored protein
MRHHAFRAQHLLIAENNNTRSEQASTCCRHSAVAVATRQPHLPFLRTALRLGRARARRLRWFRMNVDVARANNAALKSWDDRILVESRLSNNQKVLPFAVGYYLVLLSPY